MSPSSFTPAGIGSGMASGNASGSGVARIARGRRRRVRIEEGCILYEVKIGVDIVINLEKSCSLVDDVMIEKMQLKLRCCSEEEEK